MASSQAAHEAGRTPDADFHAFHQRELELIRSEGGDDPALRRAVAVTSALLGEERRSLGGDVVAGDEHRVRDRACAEPLERRAPL